MKLVWLVPWLFLAAGCNDSHPHEAGEEHAHPDGGVTFSAKRGLHVPPETAAFVGLKVADVEERSVKGEFRFAGQIYRAAAAANIPLVSGAVSTTALASGNVSPEAARVLQRGQAVTVQPDRGPALSGRIAEIEPHTDEATVEHLDVTVTIDDDRAGLVTGAFVNVQVPVGGGQPVLSVPRPALLKTAEGSFVYTASGDHFVRTAVKTGVLNDEHAEITDGLYAGDKVVVAPVMTLWMAELQSIRGGKACADGH